MEHWVGSNLELVIGSTVGVIGIAVALLIFLWEREPKRLDYEVISSVPVMANLELAFSGKLQVTYEDEQIDHPHIVVVRVKNTGKQAITRGDYVQPISFDLHEFAPAIALDGFVARESTPGIVKEVFQDFGGIHGGATPAIAPDLLNRGESFEVQYLCEGTPQNIVMTCRFRDQSRPMRNMSATRRDLMSKDLMALTALMGGMVGVIVAVQTLSPVPALLFAVLVGGLVGTTGRRLN